MVLASCQDGAEEAGPNGAVPAGYPSLHTVPSRPELSYTVEQRRAIVDGLIADRENARYSNQVVRYRTGLSGLPPPDRPLVAAAPLTPAPDVPNAGAPPPSTMPMPDRPVGAPETEFDYHDDDLDSFMEEMERRDRMAPPGEIAPGPESNAASVGRAIVRAGAARPVDPAAADYGGPAPAAVWAIPAKTAGLPTAASATGSREVSSARARIEPTLAGRAPGVVWGMLDLPGRRVGPVAGARGAQVADASRTSARAASSPVPRPAAAAAADRPDSGEGLRRTETTLAGRAPGVVWAMVDMPDRPAQPAAAANAAPVADPTAAPGVASPVARVPAPPPAIEISDQSETTDDNEKDGAPAATAVAERPDREPRLETPADGAGIEVGDGLIAVSFTPGTDDAALASIDFAPGSATLPPDASARLERYLAEVKAPDVHIRVIGEADTPALALDRALAVGLALVQRGIPADRLELTLAPDAAGDQVRLSAVASAP